MDDGRVPSAALIVSTDARRGAEVFAETLARALPLHGVSADVYAIERSEHGGLDVEVLGPGRWHPRTMVALVRQIRRHDVAVSNGGTTLLPTMLAATLARRPFVYRNIGDPTVWGAARGANWRIGLPLRRAAALTALYPTARDELVARYRVRPDRVTVVPNAASTEVFRPPTAQERQAARATFAIDGDLTWAAFVGALSPEKRPLAAVEAVLAEPTLGLLVAGDGPERGACDAAAGGTDRVRLLGSISEVRDLLWAADVVVVPSRTEGIPGVAIEAGLCGTPVVATEVGGLGHVVTDRTGVLVPPEASAPALAAAMLSAAGRRAELGAAAVEQCRAGFALDVVAGQWAGVLVSAARHRSAGRRPGIGTLSDVTTSDRRRRSQRVLDLAVLAVVAVPVSLIGAVCAIAVRLTSKGPILFRQERVGRDGAPFEVLKFRTMIDEPNPIFPDASRITSAGRILRRLSLDELPQLVNVARGEMSIVGPRPTLQYQVDRYDDHQRRRLEVRPGLTGLAQVSGRNALSWSDRIDLDIEYVDRQSVALDLSIILRTARALLAGEGVEGHPVDDPLAASDPNKT